MDIREFKELLDKFHDGTATDAEKVMLDTALKESGDGSVFDLYGQTLWQDGAAMSPERKARMKAYMMGQAHASSRVTERKRRHQPWLAVFATAAALAIGVVGGILLTRHYSASGQEETVVALGNGETSSITLSDGTVIWINSATRLSYASDYNINNRTVTLQGEAFFEVAPDKKLPFIVKTNDMAVKAVGTKFNVCAYASDDKVKATLVEGKIQASTVDDEFLLLPSQEAVYNRETGKMHKQTVSGSKPLVSWMNGEIVFDNDNLVHVGKVLERTFNVKVVIEDPSIGMVSYTGLVRNKSLKNVLDLISGTSNVAWKKVDDTIYFRKK